VNIWGGIIISFIVGVTVGCFLENKRIKHLLSPYIDWKNKKLRQEV